MLFSNIKYSWLLSMSSFLIELRPTEKSYTVLFQKIALCYDSL